MEEEKSIERNSFTNGQQSGMEQVDEFRVGAFFNIKMEPNVTASFIEKGMHMLQKNKFNVIRTCINWQEINPKSEVWDFGLYDTMFDHAAKHDIGIVVIFRSTSAGSRWLRDERQDIEWGQIDDVRIREFASEYIRRLVERYRNHPGLYGWILENETRSAPSYHPLVIARYRQWLEELYDSNIEQLNKVWFNTTFIEGKRFTSFEEIIVTEDTFRAKGGWIDHAAYRDWIDFNIWRSTEWLTWIGKEVKKYDPVHPTNVNPNSSIDIWEYASAVDYIGRSLHPGHSFPQFSMSDLPILFNFQMDELRSAGKKSGSFWLSELQGGSNIFSGAQPFTPRDYHITRWLWNARVAGCSTVLFSSLHPISLSWEGGEWGMTDMRGNLSERMVAAKNVLAAMKKHSHILAKARPIPARAAIWFSKNNYIIGEREYCRDNNRGGHFDAIKGCYKALWNANVAVDLISTEELVSGIASNYDVIYAVEMNHVSPEAAAAIGRFVEDGGSFLADGIFGWKDDHGFFYRPCPAFGLADVFGAQIEDVVGWEKPSELVFSDGTKSLSSYRYEVWLHQTSGKTVAAFSSGHPGIIENHYGKGHTMLIGTSLCRGLHKDYNPKAADFIAQFARQVIADSETVRLDILHGYLRTRSMNGPDGQVVVVTNYGEETGNGILKGKGRFSKVKELSEDRVLTAKASNDWTTVPVEIPSQGTKVYAFV